MTPVEPRPGTQEARILEVLKDHRVHTMYDWPREDWYTGRNAVSRLVTKKGWPIRSWKKKGDKVQRYQLPAQVEQEELQLAGRSASTHGRR